MTQGRPDPNAPLTGPKPVSFYRPELDAVRFIAFLSVFFFHAPHLALFEGITKTGFYALPLFFFLSAFLITELLLREQQQFGTIHLKAFYIRRSLRIWPLYFLGVFTAILWGYSVQRYRLTAQQLAYLVFLLPGFLGKEFNFNPAGVLWSISVEEIFYIIWPIAGKLKAFGVACGLLFITATVALLVSKNVWYNPLTQFFYFAAGSLLAMAIHRVSVKLNLWQRVVVVLLAAGAFLLGSSLAPEILRFSLGAVGCALAIIGVLNIDPRWIPRSFIYLGKISYGMYVFHLSCLVLVANGLEALGVRLGPVRRAVLIQLVALACSIAIAAVCYRYFETPFLKLKRRFEFVKSRPV